MIARSRFRQRTIHLHCPECEREWSSDTTYETGKWFTSQPDCPDCRVDGEEVEGDGE